MTSKNRKKDSDPLDRSYTPRWAVDQCIREVVLPYYGHINMNRILEPSAGGGVFVNAMRVLCPNAWIEAVDLDPDAGPWPKATRSVVGRSFLDMKWRTPFDLIIGNPPYGIAQAFIEKSLKMTPNLIFILRQGFMSTSERRELFRRCKPRRVGILPNRPSFSLDGKKDSADYCWMCWGGVKGGDNLFWLDDLPKQIRDF